MHPSPATVAALIMNLAAAIVTALTAFAVRPSPRGPAITMNAAPGPTPRAHERDPTVRRTQRRGAGRRIARPAARRTPEPKAAEAAEAPPREAAVTPPPQPPETVVETFYRVLDAGRFDAAWTILTPAVRSAFGGFERWRDRYATTLSNSPRDMDVERAGPEPSEACDARHDAASAAGGR